MLRNSALHFPYSLMYHCSPIDLEKKHQYPRNFFQNSHIRNLMVSKNNAEVFKFEKKVPRKIIYSCGYFR